MVHDRPHSRSVVVFMRCANVHLKPSESEKAISLPSISEWSWTGTPERYKDAPGPRIISPPFWLMRPVWKTCHGLDQVERYTTIPKPTISDKEQQPQSCASSSTYRKRLPHSLPIRIHDISTLRVFGPRSSYCVSEAEEVVECSGGVGVDRDGRTKAAVLCDK
jgi:hypothetical protein